MIRNNTTAPKIRTDHDNLWQAVPGDHGAHGAFDARARNWSPQLWTSEHRGWVATAVVALAFSGVLSASQKQMITSLQQAIAQTRRSRFTRSGECPSFSICFTIALPTTAASAKRHTARTCSGLEMPNPTATGKSLTDRTRFTKASASRVI